MKYCLLIGLLLMAACDDKPATAPSPGKESYTRSKVALADSMATRQAIERVIIAQQTAWNQGDVPGFLQGYWNDTTTTYVGRSGPRYGYGSLQATYLKAYPTPKAMGTLTFTLERSQLVGPHHAVVAGRWRLGGTAPAAQGWFTLLMEERRGQWKITYDHSSSLAE